MDTDHNHKALRNHFFLELPRKPVVKITLFYKIQCSTLKQGGDNKCISAYQNFMVFIKY